MLEFASLYFPCWKKRSESSRYVPSKVMNQVNHEAVKIYTQCLPLYYIANVGHLGIKFQCFSFILISILSPFDIIMSTIVSKYSSVFCHCYFYSTVSTKTLFYNRCHVIHLYIYIIPSISPNNK